MFAVPHALASLWLGLMVGAADPGERVELRWTGPAACPEAMFHAAFARHLDPQELAGAAVAVHADVRQEGGRWLLDLAVVGATDAGSRRLSADRCEVVVDAAAFIVVQALGGSMVPPPPEPAASVEPAPSPVHVDPVVVAVPSADAVVEDDIAAAATTPAMRRAPALRGALRVRGGASGVGLPGAQAAFGVVAGVVGPRWRAELTSVGRLPERTAAGPAVARLAMWAVGARGCGVPRVRRLEVLLCAGAEVGQVLGRSEGLMPDGGAAVVWAAVTASPGLAWAPRPWFALVLEGELAVALVRHDWVIRGLPPFRHWLGPVDVRGFAGIEFRVGRAKKP